MRASSRSLDPMNRLALYVTAPPFMHVRRLGDGRPPLGSILLADLADRPATAEELRDLFTLAPWCPVCMLLRSTQERRRVPRSPRMCSVSTLAGGGETVKVTFNAPKEPGEYLYLCTFPGHYLAGMKGLLVVK